jgi:hypothetical protein
VQDTRQQATGRQAGKQQATGNRQASHEEEGNRKTGNKIYEIRRTKGNFCLFLLFNLGIDKQKQCQFSPLAGRKRRGKEVYLK